MKVVLSASSSLSRCLLRQTSTKRRCVTAAAVASGGCRRVCAVRDNQSHRSNIIDIDNNMSCKITMKTNRQPFRIGYSSRRLMGTSTQEHGDINVAVQVANER